MSYVLLECYAMQFIALVDLNVFLSFLLCSFDFECAKSTRNVHLIIHRAVFLHRKYCCYFVQFIFSHYNFSFSNLSCKKASARSCSGEINCSVSWCCCCLVSIPRWCNFSRNFHCRSTKTISPSSEEKKFCVLLIILFFPFPIARVWFFFFEGSEENLLLLKNLALLERNL